MINYFNGQYGFLSNFYSAEVYLDGVKYATVEHAYQAAKSLDPEERKQVQLATTPAIAKKLGKFVTKRDDWDEVKVSIMHSLVKQKFLHSELYDKLMATGDEELIEGNWWGDVFWGMYKGKGRNELGKILMQVRKDLASNTPKAL